MTTDRRPLSPHLHIYRPQITSVLSIMHRGTGLVLAVGFVALVYWLTAIAGGPQQYATAVAFFTSIVGRLLMFGVAYSFFYHLCNGIRHMFWDAGMGLEMPTVHKTGWSVVFASLVLTGSAYLVAYGLLGGGA